MSQPMNYAQVAQKKEEIVREEKDVMILRYNDGRVECTINKSAELLEREQIRREKKLANSLQVRMNKAIEEIEKRRWQYRKRDIESYGYDQYTKDFYYECPESSDSESENSENLFQLKEKNKFLQDY